MKPFLLMIFVLILCGPALASEKPKEKDKADTPKYVDLAPISLPIVVEGRLVNYVFTNIRIHLTKAADSEKTRAKSPYFRDALVRMASRTPFPSAKNYQAIDEAQLISAFLPEASRIAGPGLVKGIEVKSQKPKRFMGLPKTDNVRGGSEIRP